MQKDMIVNGLSDDETTLFAGFKGQQHLPTLKLDAAEFLSVFGEVNKGDGFSIETTYEDAGFDKPCFVVMIGDKPMRERVDGKNVIVRTDTEEEALAKSEGIKNAKVIQQYTYCELPDAEYLGELREGEMLKQTVRLDKKAAASFLG